MVDSYIMLREWAYIMIIIVCFAILLTLILYSVCLLISKLKKRKKATPQHLLGENSKTDKSPMQREEVDSVVCEIPVQNVEPGFPGKRKASFTSQKDQDYFQPNGEGAAIGYLTNLAIGVKNLFVKQPVTDIPSIENLNRPGNVITVKRAANENASSSSGSEHDTDVLEELSASLKTNRKPKAVRSSLPEVALKDRMVLVEADKRKASQDSNSTRKSSVESNCSNYYQSSVTSLYK